MADCLDYYFRQRVSEAELDLGFELLEKADRNLAADLNIYGVISGAVPAPHSPVADLSVDLTAPGRAYDNLGQRIFFGTGQTVDCSVDLAGIPTDVATAGNERWLGVFLRFSRLLSDPRTDGNSQQVYFRRDESFELVVRQEAEGAAGAAPRVALQPDELLVCDVLRRPGQTQIIGSDIDTVRRQAFIFAQGTSVGVQTGLWSILQPISGTVQASLDEVDEELTEHFGGTGRRHAASAITSTARGFVSATNVQAAINEIVDDLSSSTTNNAGAARVGADAVTGTPHALAAGSVDAQLSSLLGFVNSHVGAVTGAHNASAIAAAAHSFLTNTNVQSQLQELVSALTRTAAPSGASRIGVNDSAGQLSASDIEAALAEILSAYSGDHYRSNETHAGEHRTIRQPNLGSAMALLWDSVGAGGVGARFRVYSDSSSVWFTVNASWNGSAWTRDSTSYSSGGYRFSRSDFEIFYQSSGTGSFSSFERRWRLPMSSATNSAFETVGAIQEQGRIGAGWTNNGSGSQTVATAGAVTFRNRFPTTPSSITFTTNYYRLVVNALVSVRRELADDEDPELAAAISRHMGRDVVKKWFPDGLKLEPRRSTTDGPEPAIDEDET